jgi:hypothetical protein
LAIAALRASCHRIAARRFSLTGIDAEGITSL